MRRLYALAILLLLAGCSDRSFVGRRVDNFTAYYNTFYNAREAFDEATLRFEEDNQPVDAETYLPIFIEPSGNVNNQPLEQAIQKSADLLRDHPNSKWVDDALLLIGKAYYYQQNYVGAEQKFREVVGLNGGLEGEARFWLARTLVTAGRHAEAVEYTRESLSTQEDYGMWTARMHLAQAEAYVRQGRWEDAATALDAGLQGQLDGQTAARASFLLGQVRETLQAYDLAARSYRRVLDYRASYELSYAARMNAIRLEGLHGNTRGALADLRRMERDDKNYDKRAEMQFMRARLVQVQGRFGEARRAYRALLYDVDDPPPTAVRGKAHYALAQLYRDALQDYTMAAAHFDTAATALGAPDARNAEALDRTRRTPVALTDSRLRADQFGRLAEKSEAVRRLDSLLYLGSLDDESFREAIAELEEQRAEEIAQFERKERAQARADQFAQSPVEGLDGDLADADSPAVVAATAQDGAGFLFHRSPARVQELRRGFVRRWGERPRVPNWRRLAAISGENPSADRAALAVGVVDAQAALGSVPPGVDSVETFGADAFAIDVSEVPRDPESQAAMRAARASARYELANALFLAAGQADSAATWYRLILREEEDVNVKRQALYALAEALYASSEVEEAEDYYQELIDRYPTSEFADRARERLGLEVEVRSVVDSTALAETAYAEARGLWRDVRYDEALRAMSAVAVTYPDTPMAPKALLAAGTILIEQRDSVRATMPLPDTLARTVRTLRDSTADSTGTMAVAAMDTMRAYTIRTAPDTTHALRDTTRSAAAVAPPTLAMLLETIEARYPRSPESQRASNLLAMLQKRARFDARDEAQAVQAGRVGVPADSAAGQARTPASDSLDTRLSPRTDAALTERLNRTQQSRTTRSTPENGSTNSARWVIVLASVQERVAADSTQQVYARQYQGQVVRILSPGASGPQRYRVTLGRYPSFESTKAAIEAQEARLPDDAWPLLVPRDGRFEPPARE